MAEFMIFVWGLVGGGIDEVLHWGALRRRQTLPTYAHSGRYWFITSLLVLVGGGVAYVVSISVSFHVTPLYSLIVGFSAPALVKNLSKVFLSSTTLGSGTNVPPRATWKTFLAD